MRYQKLGNTDIDVSVIALGTWGLGGGSVWTDRDSTVEDTRNLLDICREYGVNYIDTAPVYGTGASEELLGRALKGRRQDFILQSKCSLNWRNEGGNFHYERDGYTVNNDTRAAAVKKGRGGFSAQDADGLSGFRDCALCLRQLSCRGNGRRDGGSGQRRENPYLWAFQQPACGFGGISEGRRQGVRCAGIFQYSFALPWQGIF